MGKDDVLLIANAALTVYVDYWLIKKCLR
jgi:hypothetical protein